MITQSARAWGTLVALALVGVSLTGCVAKADEASAGNTFKVTASDSDCKVSAATAKSGTLTFDVKNDGTKINEFYLLAEDGLRIIGEVENITAGASRSLTVVAQPGKYFTVCKPGMVGDGVGRANFGVTGDAVKATGKDSEQKEKAVQLYAAFVKDQVSQLVPAVQSFTDAYVAGDDEKARNEFASTRVFYERIEPVAEQLGTLDPRIDYREVDAVAEGLEWTGFHRIEKDLWVPAKDALNSDGETSAWKNWQPSTPAERKTYADKLNKDVKELYDYVHGKDFQKSLDAQGIGGISNGAIALLDEVATGKISGEEDWWSHTDLTDFAANVEGSEMAFSLVKDFATSKGKEGEKLSEEISKGYDNLKAALAKHGSLKDGFADYSTVTEDQRRELTDELNALAEPLSKLSATILE